MASLAIMQTNIVGVDCINTLFRPSIIILRISVNNRLFKTTVLLV